MENKKNKTSEIEKANSEEVLTVTETVLETDENSDTCIAETVTETIEEKGEFEEFDDEAEAALERQAKEQKIEEDKILPPDPDAILEVRHLKKYFVLKKTFTGKPLSTLKAVDDVSFKIKKGETLGIVGESGCGKTTMGRTILKLHQPTSGQIFFEGEDIAKYKSKQMIPLRTKMQIVFQDPYSSLPPRSTVGGILSEPVAVHDIVPKDQIKDYVLDLMDQCGLRDYYYERYPHEFSGGQQQKLALAKLLLANPEVLFLDEPTKGLDPASCADFSRTVRELADEGKTIVFVTHDLDFALVTADFVSMPFDGEIACTEPVQAFFANNIVYRPNVKSRLFGETAAEGGRA